MSLCAVVAIPARDEAERIEACLAALADQRDASGRQVAGGTFGVVLFANDCHDETVPLARARTASLPFPLRVVERDPPPGAGHAGWARRTAMDLAADWLEGQNSDAGVLLTTDADSRVASNWLSANLAAIAEGVDGVAGCIVLDPSDDLLLPLSLHRRGILEGQYEELLAELRARLDPQPHDPWPHHATASGASLAVTLGAYRRIGGLPAPPVGEDKALVAALHAHDARVRHALAVRVTTSGRLEGRATGGVADTLRLRSSEPDAYCDEALEPVGGAIRRAVWRRRLRHLHALGRLSESGSWVGHLGLHPHRAATLTDTPYFGAAWRGIEQASSLLRRLRIRPSELPDQIHRARLVLHRLQETEAAIGGSAGPGGTLPLVPA